MIAAITMACGPQKTTAAVPATPPVANHPAMAAGSDRDLDALAFLDGCWSKWDVDWGFHLCWKRAGAAWLGSLETGGPMGPKWRVEFRIARGDHALEWTATTLAPQTWFAANPVVELTASGHDLAIFGSRKSPVDRVIAQGLTRDTLVFQPNEKMGQYRLSRRTDLAP
jgi:hypothetical protein